jgi:DNA modification methylase
LDRTLLDGRIGNNTWTIYPKNCIEALKRIKENSIDCIITSPPYANSRAYGEMGREEGNKGNYRFSRYGQSLDNEIGFGQSTEEYFDSLEEVFKSLYRVLKKNRCFFINVDKIRRNFMTFDISYEIINRAKKQGFVHRDTIIWIKSNPRPLLRKAKPYYLDDGWEYLLLFTKGKAVLNRENYVPFTNSYECESCKNKIIVTKKTQPNYFQTNIGFTEESLKSLHPAKFPLALPNFALSLCTKEGDTILDPFAGIGTSLVAGLKKKLNVIGCEINMKYCNAAIKEITALDNDINIVDVIKPSNVP